MPRRVVVRVVLLVAARRGDPLRSEVQSALRLVASSFAVAPALLLASVSSGAAQDVELASALRGIPLPAAYYARVAQQPHFFEIGQGWIGRATRAALASRAVAGQLPLLVIPALFSDSPDPPFSSAALQAVLFDGPAEHGTLSDYYAEVSGRRFRVAGRVVPWVRTALTRAQVVGSSYGLGDDARTGEFLVQALAAADSTTAFGAFDNDGADGVPNSDDDDGFVDAVAFEFAEVAASCGGPGIWPHRSRVAGWTGAPYATKDQRPDGSPVRVNDYIVQSAVSCAGDRIQTAATIAHELGHVLGLPDIYHPVDGILPAQRRWILGCWDLMAAGSWGCGDGASNAHALRPTHMGAWSKERLGWIALDTVGPVREQEFRLEPVELAGRGLRIPVAGSEYFLVEHRARTGFDAELPAAGVLIYHVDPTAPFRPCAACPRTYRVSLEEADGNRALLRTAAEGGNRGEAGDAFAALTAQASFSNVTVPSTRSNRDSVTAVTLHAIELNGAGRARVLLSTAETPAVLGTALPQGTALRPYAASVRAGGGALPYRWELAAGVIPEGVRFVDSTATFAGTPLQPGEFTVTVRVQDIRGSTALAPATLRIDDAAIPLVVLLQPLLVTPATPPTELEQHYLDLNGNRNGRYDLGDLRARVLSNPALLEGTAAVSR